MITLSQLFHVQNSERKVYDLQTHFNLGTLVGILIMVSFFS